MKSDIELTFPDVTICDSVIVSDNALIKHNKVAFFYEVIQRMLIALSENNIFTASFSKEEMEALENWMFTTNVLISNVPEDERSSIGSQFESLVVDCMFSERHCNTSNFEAFIDPNHLMCYTFKAKTILSKFRDFVGPDFGLSLILRGEPNLNFRYNKNSKTENTHGIHIDIHAPDTIPFVGSSGVYLSPGRSTFIDLSEKHFLRLNEPYSKCLPQQKVEILSKTYISEPNFCFSKCVHKFIQDMCNCSSATFGGISKNYQEHCLYLNPINKSAVDLTKAFCEMITFLGDKKAMKCKRCPWNCNEIKYNMKISNAPWPEPPAIPNFIIQFILSLPEDNPVKLYYEHLVRTFFSKNSIDDGTKIVTFMDVNQFMFSEAALQDDILNQYLSESYSGTIYPILTITTEGLIHDLQRKWVETSFYRLNIFFSEPFVTVQKQVPSFKFQDYWSGIGGVLGIWAGASVLTMLELCSFLGKLVITKWFMVKEKPRSRKVNVLGAREPITNLT